METMKRSNLEFKVETPKSIRVIDKIMDSNLVGKITYNPALGLMEFEPNTEYIFYVEDLYIIANYMSKLDLSNPQL